uniref:UDP-N-acetylglucosamine diphosphorylase n=1 Tax=Romanomermis culicivorax TaxID=13658 RepID=A0A915HP38_ROMCU
MQPPTNGVKSKLELELKNGDQDKLLQLLPQLDDDDLSNLYSQLSSLPPIKRLAHLFRKAVEAHSIPADELRTRICKIDESHYWSYKNVTCSTMEKFWQTVSRNIFSGLEAIAKSQVAVILMAGGQGTRLGVPYPKGMYKVGLPSGKSLFQLQAERILRLQNLAKLSYPEKIPSIPWYIMTSEATKATTQRFFEENSYFGLDRHNIVFFEQGLMPCFDFDGNILLESKRRIALSPDGNGGLYEALIKSGALKDLSERKTKYIHAYCVDNILVRVADPIFVGFCIENDADCGNKVVEKKVPNEPIGVVCHIDSVGPCVVEYSEMPKELTEEREEDNRLIFRAGNIANHFFTVDFLDDVCNNHIDDLPYHVANKKIPCIDLNGERIEPVVPNGIKLEKFVFDVFPLAK